MAAFTEAQLPYVWASALRSYPIILASLPFGGLLPLHLSPDKILPLTA